MPDVTYVLMTLLAFAALAVLVGRLDRRLEEDPPGGTPEPHHEPAQR